MINAEIISVGQDILNMGWKISIWRDVGMYIATGQLQEITLTSTAETPKSAINALAAQIMGIS